jgi:hypothetical protein
VGEGVKMLLAQASKADGVAKLQRGELDGCDLRGQGTGLSRLLVAVWSPVTGFQHAAV